MSMRPDFLFWPILPLASAAVASTLALICIGLIVWMSSRAVRAPGLILAGVSPLTVYLMAHRVQVLRINAARNTTLVVKFHPFRNWPNVDLIRDGVRSAHIVDAPSIPVSGPIQTELAVTTHGCSGPEPTSRVWLRGNEFHESVDGTLIVRHPDSYQVS